MRIIGLISGTSVDGIDAAAVDVQGQGYDLSIELLAGVTHPYPTELQRTILNLCAGQPITLDSLANLDDAVAHEFAQAARAVMAQVGSVDLVASHGQTVFHRPAVNPPVAQTQPTTELGYSLQLGRGAVIAHSLGVPTVSDFRRADIEAGGQGAPLVPIVDLCLFGSPDQYRCVQNIGGIGNVAYLPPWDRQAQSTPPKVLGWDTGPGNSLIDIAVQEFSQGVQTYDRHGEWAARGRACMALVEQWLAHPYLAQLPPKSTGRELFGWEFFRQCQIQARPYGLSEVDLVASLTEFTAASVAQSYHRFLPTPPAQVLICGGGSYNPVLLQRLQTHLGHIPVSTTNEVGVPADFKEAIAFAVLGFWHWQETPSNLPTVTGAQLPVVLGELCCP
jgi:anhydro-N-acetylmuramic acid kinase